MRFRLARADEAEALRDLERTAGLAAHAHIFPAAEHAYPDQAVLDRWHRVLSEPEVTVLVHEDALGLDCLVALDPETVRHLAVRPDRWRSGLATAAVQHVVATSSARRLWCLEENAGALALYDRLGWVRTGRSQPAEWPPYPTEVELVLVGDRPPRAARPDQSVHDPATRGRS